MPEIRLVPTLDILAELGRRRRPGQVLVGFAAETDGLVERLAAKLEAKDVDLMVGNDVGAQGVGFAYETNAVTILQRGGARTEIPLQSKRPSRKPSSLSPSLCFRAEPWRARAP